MDMSQIFTKDTLIKKLLRSANKETVVTLAVIHAILAVAASTHAAAAVDAPISWSPVDRENFDRIFTQKDKNQKNCSTYSKKMSRAT